MKELEPVNVFRFFSEISAIPRGSGNTDAIAEYCMDFARSRQLDAYRDGYGNVMIFKGGTHGLEESKSVILQGHMDMVCAKRPDCRKDMEKEGVDLMIDGAYLRANGTTLGGDDGIALAYILAILDDDSLAHPPIEALITTDEETGLRGAHALDSSRLTGRQLINIDSEEEGVLTVSCAGAARVTCRFPVTYQPVEGDVWAIHLSVTGLLGGHSGIDIGKNRKNAAKLLSDFLFELSGRVPVRLSSFTAGGALNVIAPTAEAVVCTEKRYSQAFVDCLSAFNDRLKVACAATEPNALVTAAESDVPDAVLDDASHARVVSALTLAPDGVFAMSADIPFLVQTSSNLGSVTIEDGFLTMGFMIRSNTDYGNVETFRRMRCLAASLGGEISESDKYPAWEYRQDSPLRETMIQTYEELYGVKPRTCAIHAGLECGILAEKLRDVDMVSIGPNMKNVHTPDEQLEIKSVQRCWEYLVHALANLK